MASNLNARSIRPALGLYCAAVAASLLAPKGAAGGNVPAQVAVAWTDGATGGGHIRSFPAAAPWAFDTPTLDVGPNSTLRVAGGRLYVVSKTDASVAVIDLATEQLIDADAATAGTQAIELQGMAPKLKMQIVPSARRLFVSASGDFFDDGGIEVVNLDTLRSLGLIVREEDDMTGADLGAFVLVTPDRGYLTFSTDFATSSHMVEFTVSGGVVPGGELFGTVGYFVPTLPLDSQSNTIFFPDGGFPPSAVHVLDAATASYLATVSIGANTFPTDVVVIPGAAAGSAIPAVSTRGVWVFALLVTAAASAILARRERQPS